MKILSVITSPGPGGAEMLVRNLTAEFARLGHDCRILFMSSAVNVGNPASFEREYVAGIHPDVRYALMEAASYRNPVRSALELRRTVRSFRPDLLHIHVARGMLARSLSGVGVPTVFTHHGTRADFPPWLFRLFDRFVQRYVAIGAASRAFLERHVRGPITVIPNGVPADFAPAEARRPLSATPLALSVGNLKPEKDYSTLIAAADIVGQMLGSGAVRFAIAGEGFERPLLEAMIAERGLSPHVELLGPRFDIPELLAKADFFVNSSVTEGLAISLIEAAMAGLPMVATDVGGNGEIVQDGVNGFLVPPRRPDLLAGRICDLVSDPDRHSAFAARSAALAQRFTLSACVESHLDLYREVLAARRSG